MIKVRLNGAVTYVQVRPEDHAAPGTNEIIATTLEPVLPHGDWIEVTSIGSDMREFASADRVWAGEDHEPGHLS